MKTKALLSSFSPAVWVVSFGAALGALWFSFIHLMQTTPWFAEAVAKVSPSLASATSCGCPFCQKACSAAVGANPADNRLDKLAESLNNKHGF